MTDWNDSQIRELINERRNRNIEYHGLAKGRQKRAFWDDVARKINRQHNASFTGDQCHNKFLNLTRAYNVSSLNEFQNSLFKTNKLY